MVTIYSCSLFIFDCKTPTVVSVSLSLDEKKILSLCPIQDSVVLLYVCAVCVFLHTVSYFMLGISDIYGWLQEKWASITRILEYSWFPICPKIHLHLSGHVYVLWYCKILPYRRIVWNIVFIVSLQLYQKKRQETQNTSLYERWKKNPKKQKTLDYNRSHQTNTAKSQHFILRCSCEVKINPKGWHE